MQQLVLVLVSLSYASASDPLFVHGLKVVDYEDRLCKNWTCLMQEYDAFSDRFNGSVQILREQLHRVFPDKKNMNVTLNPLSRDTPAFYFTTSGGLLYGATPTTVVDFTVMAKNHTKQQIFINGKLELDKRKLNREEEKIMKRLMRNSEFAKRESPIRRRLVISKYDFNWKKNWEEEMNMFWRYKPLDKKFDDEYFRKQGYDRRKGGAFFYFNYINDRYKNLNKYRSMHSFSKRLFGYCQRKGMYQIGYAIQAVLRNKKVGKFQFAWTYLFKSLKSALSKKKKEPKELNKHTLTYQTKFRIDFMPTEFKTWLHEAPVRDFPVNFRIRVALFNRMEILSFPRRLDLLDPSSGFENFRPDQKIIECAHRKANGADNLFHAPPPPPKNKNRLQPNRKKKTKAKKQKKFSHLVGGTPAPTSVPILAGTDLQFIENL